MLFDYLYMLPDFYAVIFTVSKLCVLFCFFYCRLYVIADLKVSLKKVYTRYDS